MATEVVLHKGETRLSFQRVSSIAVTITVEYAQQTIFIQAQRQREQGLPALRKALHYLSQRKLEEFVSIFQQELTVTRVRGLFPDRDEEQLGRAENTLVMFGIADAPCVSRTGMADFGLELVVLPSEAEQLNWPGGSQAATLLEVYLTLQVSELENLARELLKWTL